MKFLTAALLGLALLVATGASASPRPEVATSCRQHRCNPCEDTQEDDWCNPCEYGCPPCECTTTTTSTTTTTVPPTTTTSTLPPPTVVVPVPVQVPVPVRVEPRFTG